MSIPTTIHARINGPLVIVGFGSIGKGTLPLILRHLDVPRSSPVFASKRSRCSLRLCTTS